MTRPLTTEEFIEKAKVIHGDMYDYSHVKYRSSHTKVKIFCNKCKNMFEQQPSNHLQGKGCPFHGRCSNTKDFIQKAQKIHGKDKYDYSKVVYVGNKTKVTIICNTCGQPFTQTPHEHLSGSGCPIEARKLISDSKRSNTETFIKKAKAIHGSLYDYSNVEYIRNSTKVKILCNQCKTFFEQTPQSHLAGHGCSVCFRKRIANTYSSDTEEFILRAKKCHGDDRYDYSKVEYITARIKVTIICNKCKSEFKQKPYHHLNGHEGCPICKDKKRADSRRSTVQEFIQKAQKKYGCDKYDYSQTKYIRNTTKIVIWCNICGKRFSQTPSHHLSGRECPNCLREESSGELFIKKWLLSNTNLEFQQEYRIPECRHKLPLPFDFAIFNPQQLLLIEYNGKQHYEPIKYFGGKAKLKIQQHRDKIKHDYCCDNNVPLLIIPYWLSNEDIENNLHDFIYLNDDVRHRLGDTTTSL